MEIQPKMGEIRRGEDIGKNRGMPYTWLACGNCDKKRWVIVKGKKTLPKLCKSCATTARNKSRSGKLNPRWNGGRRVMGDGYIQIMIDRKDPLYPMATSDGYVLEHRLMIATSLGRCLLPSEIVHHINGIKGDNRLENLKLLSPLDHNTYTRLCPNCELRKEIRLLRWQVKEQSEQIRNLSTHLMMDTSKELR